VAIEFATVAPVPKKTNEDDRKRPPGERARRGGAIETGNIAQPCRHPQRE
jgi:hypothetical protein